MREIYEETNRIDWDKKIVIELSLLELQMIKDLVRKANKQDAIGLFKSMTTEPCPYDSFNCKVVCLWDGLKEIVERNGGVV